MDTKRCPKCQKTLPIDKFYKDKFQANGIRSKCKECCTKSHAVWCNKNSASVTSYRKNYRYLNLQILRDKDNAYCMTLKRKFQRWRTGAKVRGITWNLKLEDIINMPLVCYYTGEPLTLELNQYNTVSLDRIGSQFGYFKDNVVFCCSEINLMKRKLSVDEFVRLCKLVAANKNEESTNIKTSKLGELK